MQTKILLDEKDMPRQWYNIQADLASPLPPPLNPATGQPVGPDDLAPIFPMNLIEQEMSRERWMDIPERGAGKAAHLEADAPLPGAAAGEIPRHPGAHLFQA